MSPATRELTYVDRMTAAGYVLTAQWRTGPAGAIVAVEVWGRRADRTAVPWLITAASSIEAGAVTAGGTDDAFLIWTTAAAEAYDEAWLHAQESEVLQALVRRWADTGGTTLPETGNG